MAYPIGPKTKDGWPYTCMRCGTTFYKQKRFDMKYCPDCGSHGEADQKRRYIQRLKEEKAAREEARLGAGPAGGTDYCKRMWLTNPGSMCGTRDFCIGCEFAGDGKCRDSESFWGV